MMMGYHSPDYPVMGNDPRITRTWGAMRKIPELSKYVYCYIDIITGEYGEKTCNEIAKIENISSSKIYDSFRLGYVLRKRYKFIGRKHVADES